MILAGLAGVLFMVNITYFQAVRHISAIDYPLTLCVGLSALLALGDGYTPAHPIAGAALFTLGTLPHSSIASIWLLAAYMHWHRGDLTITALATLLGLLPYLLLTEATILGLLAEPSRCLYMASANLSLYWPEVSTRSATALIFMPLSPCHWQYSSTATTVSHEWRPSHSAPRAAAKVPEEHSPLPASDFAARRRLKSQKSHTL